MNTPSKGFPGAALWLKFEDTCKEAEVEFGRAMKEAATERDRVLKAPCQWGAPAAVEAAVEARYSRKKQAAQARRDEKCKEAQDALFKGLDERERRRNNSTVTHGRWTVVRDLLSAWAASGHAAPGQRAPDESAAGIWISTVNPMMPIATTAFFSNARQR